MRYRPPQVGYGGLASRLSASRKIGDADSCRAPVVWLGKLECSWHTCLQEQQKEKSGDVGRMTKPLIEEIELSGTVMAQFDGSYTVTFRIAGLTQDDANAISELLRTPISQAVVQVLKGRQILSPEGPPRRLH
jgi:hypothetical protein